MKSITHYIHRLSQIMILAVMVTLSSCSDSDEPKQDAEQTRTVLVYMVSHNNLSSYALADIGEMQEAALEGHLGTSRLIVYRHPYGGDPSLYEILYDGSIKLLKTYDSARPSISSLRLEEVIADTKVAAPADKYGIIFWGHGSGYVQDGITPKSYGGELISGTSYWMNVTDMAEALGQKQFDWIYFDCCFMAGVEVAYELRSAADYIIASATELPADGMPYQLTLRHLMPLNSDLQAAVNSTFDYYNSFTGSKRTCTMSLIKTEALDHLAQSMRNVLTRTDGLPSSSSPQPFQTPGDHRRYGWSYYDLLDYASALLPGDTEIARAINEAVPLSLATPMLWNEIPITNHCGLSTLIIENADDPDLDKFNYRQLAWWRDVVSYRFSNP